MASHAPWIIKCSKYIHESPQVLRPFIGKFLRVYFDDILIYNNWKEQHHSYLQQIYITFRKEQLYTNLKKCMIMSSQVIYFHGLRTFYHIQGFSTIMAPITDNMKNGEFSWRKAAMKAFKEIKTKMTKALVMRLPDFSKVFEVACNASSIRIKGGFNEKLNETKQKFSNYEREFYTVIQTLKYWRNYFSPQVFVLYSDHEALKYLNSQTKLKSKHTNMDQKSNRVHIFMLKHKPGVENKGVDALSHRLCCYTRWV